MVFPYLFAIGGQGYFGQGAQVTKAWANTVSWQRTGIGNEAH